ncbi:hypothetical protein Sta7437_4694 (plasmid) [Stanieria cyanosphaera PCC 7437]|uniref:Uncharacterized protein n=1 Tax=Stanieria cyanosphaera (strain ATCC 29371 / PCC 7437) TaxID=111780 RepID=K9Y1E6_STAC7|nr:hypothetical protein Sta7437_4694 [Stanieria cyanosphaera PCC 7437]
MDSYFAVGIVFSPSDNHGMSLSPTYLLVRAYQGRLALYNITRFSRYLRLRSSFHCFPLAPKQVTFLFLATFSTCFPRISLLTLHVAYRVFIRGFLYEGMGRKTHKELFSRIKLSVQVTPKNIVLLTFDNFAALYVQPYL